MHTISFPKYNFKIKDEDGKSFIFDELRKKWIILTPEESVRQHLWMYLHKEKNYPISHMACEKTIKVNSLNKRFDLMIYDRSGTPFLIAECKAPNIKLDQKVLDQVLRYNIAIKCKYVIITNGIDIYCCNIDFSNAKISFLNEIPLYLKNS